MSAVEFLSDPRVLGALLLYFLPTLFAVYRKSASWPTCLGVNLVFGWTLVGWVAAVVLAHGPSRERIAYRNRVRRARDEFYLREERKQRT